MPIEPAQQRRTSETVAHHIRRMLADGTLRPGDKLPPERDLKVILGVCRPAIREGLRMLEATGLVEQRKGRTGGTFVARGDMRSVSRTMQDLLILGQISLPQLTEARLWIQDIVVRVACDRAAEDDLLALEQNVNDAQYAFNLGQWARQSDLNIDFHNILARATHNPILVLNVRTITEVLRGFSQRMGPDRSGESFDLRRELIRALRARRKSAAASAIAAILQRAQRMYTELAAQLVSPSPRVRKTIRKSKRTKG